MRNRDRADAFREVIVIAGHVARDLPAMTDALADRRGSTELVPVSGGDRSDPTSRTALASVEQTRRLDHLVLQLRNTARELESMRVGLTGDAPPVELVDDRGRPAVDGKGRPIEHCALHHAALADNPRADIPQARRNIPHPSGQGKLRVCRWCGDFYDRAGQAPTTGQILDHADGRRVYIEEAMA